MILGSDLIDPRKNNFTLVRFVLASSVIYTHCYWLLRGVEGEDELSFLLGAPISAYAVDGFFFLSGFLVYPSLLRFGKASTFLFARLARLLPGLGLSLVLTVLGGLFVTSVPPQQYFSGETLRFLFLNFSLLTPAYYLTGVECGTGLCNMNGSLWTLPWEARCYVVLALLGALGLARPTLIARFLLPATLVGVLVWDVPAVQSAVTAFVGEGPAYLINMFDRLWALFALGIAAYVFRDRIKLSWLWLGLLFGINLAAHAAGLGLHVRAIFIGYAVLCFGFLTARERAISAEWPDYSYGMYIFAFPVMLAAQALVATSSHHLLALINLLVTLPLAALSWHLVEKPALDAFRRSRSRMVPTPLLHP
jgi:peptidoglycan/LPS O-acetylase OafA/YrhL